MSKIFLSLWWKLVVISMQLYYHLLACCKDIVLQFGGQESSQKSMEGEYTYDKNSSNSRFDYNHVISNGKLSFHSAFSRWQVTLLWIVQYNTCWLQFKYTVIERYEIKVKYIFVQYRCRTEKRQLYYQITAPNIVQKTAKNIFGSWILMYFPFGSNMEKLGLFVNEVSDEARPK